jgi:hypothetical protein
MLAGGLLVVVSTAAALAATGHAATIPVLSAIGSFLPGGGGADFHRIAQLLSSHGAPLAACFAAAAVTSLVLFLAARNRRWGICFVAIVLSVAILGTSVRLLILPELAKQRTRRNFVAAVRATLSDPGALSAYRNFDYGMVYYWGAPIPVEHSPLSSSGPRYVVMSESEWVNMDKQERRTYERLPGLESGRGGNLGRLIVAQRIVSPPTTDLSR